MPQENRKVTIVGWYGHQNLGDELMLMGLRQLFDGWIVNVMSNTSKSSYPVFDAKVANDSDLLILGGGELIQRNQLFLEQHWTDRVSEFLPKFILGCGVNAQKYSQLNDVMLRELEKFCFIGLRDRVSLCLLNGSPSKCFSGRLGLFYDPVFSLDVSQVKPVSGGENLFVVVPTDRVSNRFDFGVEQTNFAGKFARELKCNLGLHDHVVFIAFGNEDNDDYVTCKKIAGSISNSYEIVSGVDPWKVLPYFAGANRVYSSRLHGVVLAKLFGKSCMFYPYHFKVQRVADTLLGCEPSLIRDWQRNYLALKLNQFLGGVVC